MNWQQENDKLIREFSFQNFSEAVDFVNKVKDLAEEHDHHPDILIHSYKKVKIMLSTHSEGSITDKDRSLAKSIDRLAE